MTFHWNSGLKAGQRQPGAGPHLPSTPALTVKFSRLVVCLRVYFREMPGTSPRVAIVAARESAKLEFRSFTAVYCGSVDQGSAAGADVIVIDLTEGIDEASFPRQPLVQPYIAILPEHTPPEDVALAARVFGDVTLGWPALGELLRRCRKLLEKPNPVAAEEELLHDIGLRGLLGNSPRFREALAKIPLLGRSGGNSSDKTFRR
jgi:hypothetical protein